MSNQIKRMRTAQELADILNSFEGDLKDFLTSRAEAVLAWDAIEPPPDESLLNPRVLAFLPRLRRIASGTLPVETYTAFNDRPGVMNLVATLPRQEQLRLAAGVEVEIVALKNNGEHYVIKKPATELEYWEAKRLIRHEVQQTKEAQLGVLRTSATAVMRRPAGQLLFLWDKKRQCYSARQGGVEMGTLTKRQILADITGD